MAGAQHDCMDRLCLKALAKSSGFAPSSPCETGHLSKESPTVEQRVPLVMTSPLLRASNLRSVAQHTG